MAETREKRTGWIDLCKAMAIYCMVLGHTGTSEKMMTVIHAFHMPVFFILSGYCFNEIKNSDLWQLTRKRFKTLIIPYFVFGTGLFLFWDVVLYVMHRQPEMRSLSNLLTSILWNNTDASAFSVIQWFLPCLFMAEILFASLVKITGGRIFVVFGGITFLSVIGYMIPYVTDQRLPWALDCALMASAFYGLGWIMKKIQILDRLRILKGHKAVSLIAVIVITAAAVLLVFRNGAVNMRTVTYGNYFLYIFNAVVCSSILIVLSMLLDWIANGNTICKFLEWIGRNTLIVLMLNMTCIKVYEVVCGGILDQLSDITVYGINIAAAAIITVICAIASEFINRYLPWLAGKF